MMARLASLFVLSSVLLTFVLAEPDYCKRGVKVSEAYQHCFEEAHFKYPYLPLFHPKEIIDGCMVEDYNNHTCSVVKPAALECFRRNISRCHYRERLFAIADESGGACFGNHINRDFKEYVLNYLQPVRADSGCFVLADSAYECYSEAASQMNKLNPNMHFYTVDQYMPVANKFFDNVYNCFIRIYKSNEPICENWQIPLLLELQGTALPSLFGMTFTPRQMERLELHDECLPHGEGHKPHRRICYDRPGNNNNNLPQFPKKNPAGGISNNNNNNLPQLPEKNPAAVKPQDKVAGDEPAESPEEPELEEQKKKKKKQKKKKNRNKKKNRKGKKKKQKGRKKGGRKQKKAKGEQGGKDGEARPISPRFLHRLREALS